MVLLAITFSFANIMGTYRAGKKDFFDPEMLKIDEGKFLGGYVANVPVKLPDGTTVNLYELLKDKPTILVFSYYTCEGSCPIRVDNLKELIESSDTLKKRQYNVLVLSFDSKDNLETMTAFIEKRKPFTPHWIFGILDRNSIERLTSSTGFKFFYSERDKTFVHTNVYIFLSPDGKITRYLFGIKPKERDVRIALAEAEGGKVSLSSVLDLALLVCYTYDPSRSSFVINPTIIFGGIGFAILGSIALFAFVSNRFAKREVQ
jgi:protein SCO1/2